MFNFVKVWSLLLKNDHVGGLHVKIYSILFVDVSIEQM